MSVIFTVRHPASFAMSLEKKNWSFSFSHWAKTPEAYPYLGPFKEQVLEASQTNWTIRKRAILVWNVIHHQMNEWVNELDRVHVLRNEDLSRDPNQVMKGLFSELELPWENRVERYLERTTHGKGFRRTARSSKSLVDRWKSFYTPSEIDDIRESRKTVWPHFYQPNEW